LRELLRGHGGVVLEASVGVSGACGRGWTDSERGQVALRVAQRRMLKAMATSSTWAEALARPM